MDIGWHNITDENLGTVKIVCVVIQANLEKFSVDLINTELDPF
jgi:hypothetical protein